MFNEVWIGEGQLEWAHSTWSAFFLTVDEVVLVEGVFGEDEAEDDERD